MKRDAGGVGEAGVGTKRAVRVVAVIFARLSPVEPADLRRASAKYATRIAPVIARKNWTKSVTTIPAMPASEE